MKNTIYILLAAVLMITFSLFLGWLPQVGKFIPKIAVLLYVVLFVPNLMRNKAFFCLSLFYMYVIIQSVAYGYGFDLITWVANFVDYALPVFLLQAAIKDDNEKTVRTLARFSTIFILTTIIMSIVVISNNPVALREQQGMTVMGDTAAALQYNKQGLASYAFAAMIMCLPAVLVSVFKTTNNKRVRLYSIVGIILSFVFMWMGQVTTTLLICISLAFISIIIKETTSQSIIIGAALFILVIGLFGSSIIDVIAPYTEGTAMSDKFANFSSNLHGQGNETEEGSVEGRMELTVLTLKVFGENPLFGDPQGFIGGHNFFIDRFALYGVVGVIPFFLMLYFLYGCVIRYLPQNKRVIYKLIFLGFIALGLLKNMSGMEYWLFIFCFYPFILKYSSSFDKDYQHILKRALHT